MSKNVKSTFVKILAALALAFACVTVVQAFSSNSTQTVQAAKLSKKERAAKRWIAMRESGGNYTARNGSCYGKYQLSIGYLHGNLSPKNKNVLPTDMFTAVTVHGLTLRDFG